MTESAGSLVPRPTSGAPVDRARLRASDADRQRVADVLHAALADGRLDLTELDERLAATYAARTYGELEPITADLVAAPEAPAEAPAIDTDTPLELRTRAGNIKQVRRWIVPRHIVAECTSGNIKIDFTEADCRYADIRVDATCRSGNVTLIVPPGWRVLVERAQSGMGNVRNRIDDPHLPGMPTIHLYASARSGNVTARHAFRTRRGAR